MKTTFQIEIKSDKQMRIIHKVEKLLTKAGIAFDKQTDVERKIREWDFHKIEGAKLIVEQDNKLTLFMRIYSIKRQIDKAEITDTKKIEEAYREIAQLERELEFL